MLSYMACLSILGKVLLGKKKLRAAAIPTKLDPWCFQVNVHYYILSNNLVMKPK